MKKKKEKQQYINNKSYLHIDYFYNEDLFLSLTEIQKLI